MSVCIRISKKSSLKHLIGRGLYSGHEIRRFVRHLFDFREIVLRVAVENHFSDFDKRVVFVRPNLTNNKILVNILCQIF